MLTMPTMLAEATTALLMNPVKPILLVLTFIPWGWLVSSRLEKDARYFHLNSPAWNAAFLAGGIIGLLVFLFVPIFWIGWPAAIIVLAAPVLIYWKVRNGQVPEKHRFTLSNMSVGEKMEARKQAKAARDVVLTFFAHDKTKVPVPSKEDPAFMTHLSTEELIGPAMEARASSVELAVNRQGAASGQTVDGIRYKRDTLTVEDAMKVVDFVKGLAGMDVADRRRRQRGTFRVSGPSGQPEMTVTTAGSSNGLNLRVEIDRPKQLSRPFDLLGLLPMQVARFDPLLEEETRHGIVLVGAPAGQGLRSSIYSMLGRHDAYTSNIKSFEREVELRLDGVDHVEFEEGPDAPAYGEQLRSILRRDPDIVQTGFVQDQETAKVCVGPGMEGPLLYVPMRLGSLGEMIQQWVKLVGDHKEAARSLQVVSNQRLMRTLCPRCRQAYAPPAEQLAKLGIPKDKVQQLFRPGGQIMEKNKPEPCPVCRGTGYLGQTAVFEVIKFDRDMRKMLATGDLKGVLAHARRNKMVKMQEAALAKVVSGDTSLEEVARITAAPKPAAKRPSKPAPAPA